MARQVGKEVIEGFIDEVQGYLPAIREALNLYQSDPSRSDDFDHAYRLTHTIKGASSMVGLAALCHAASQQEELLEQIGAGDQALDEPTRQILASTYDRMESYLSGLSAGRADDGSFLLIVIEAYRQYRHQSLEGAVEEVTRLLTQSKSPIASNGDQFGNAKAPAAHSDLAGGEELQGGMGAYIDDFCRQADLYLKDVRNCLAEAAAKRNRKQTLVQARPIIHSLKGEAGMIGFHEMAHLAYQMEEVLDRVVDGSIALTEDVSSLLADSIEVLDAMVIVKGSAEPVAEGLRDLNDQYARLILPIAKVEPEYELPTEAQPSVELDERSSIPPELQEVFAEEAEEHLHSLYAGLSDLEKDPKNVQLMQDIRRAAHTLKGAAGAIGLAAIANLSGRLERLACELLETGRPLSADLMQLLFASTDTLQDLADDNFDRAQMRRTLAELHAAFDVVSIGAAVPIPVGEPAVKMDTGEDQGAPLVELDDRSQIAPELLAIFSEEAEDHLRHLYTGLSGLEKHPNDQSLLKEVRRAAHTLKGAAGAVGLRMIAQLAHRMEDVLDQLFEGGRPLTVSVRKLLFDSTDVLQDLAGNQYDPLQMRATLADLFAQFENVNGRLSAQSVDRVEREPSEDAMEEETVLEPTSSLVSDVEVDDRSSIPVELAEIFAQEAEDHLKHIYGSLAGLQKHPRDREILGNLRRAVHTLKGAAGAVSLRTLTQLAHRMEDVLDQLFDGALPITPALMKLFFATADTLQDLATGNYSADDVRITLAGLYQRYDTVLASPAGSLKTEERKAAAESKPLRPGKAAKRREPVLPPRKPGEVLRVPLERLDELVRLVSELVINRTAFEQRMTDYTRGVEELRLAIGRMKNLTGELQSRYETSALGGGRLSRFGGFGGSAGPTYFSGDFHSGHDFDSLEFDRYTEFHLLSRSLIETTTDIGTLGSELNNLIGDFETLLTRQGRLTREIQNKLMRARMVPLGTITTRFERAVRVLATEQDKQVDLVFEGEQTELDKTVLEEMADPLLHLLRNAVDHGVEPPAVRRAKGKPEKATVQVRAFYQGTQVVLQIVDDGIGLDPQMIRATAVRNGFLTQEDAEQLSTDDIYHLIFVPGFSTASKVSEVSGRGVGMDIVKSKVNKLKGLISIDSTPGIGTTFTIRLPMTLAITKALLVKTQGQTFAIPLQSVDQVIRIEASDIERSGKEPVLRIGGKVYPVYRLWEVLRLKETFEAEPAMLPVMIVNSGDRKAAVIVEQILSGREIVVKTLGNHLRRVRGLIGATLMGDGSVVPILNVSELLRVAPRVEAIARVPETVRPIQGEDLLSVMVVDDSVSVRRVVSNLVKSVGWTAVAAKDGLDALEILQQSTKLPDLIVLDVEMPRMNGYDLLATLRSQEAYRNTPVIMVTSRAGEKHRRRAFELGANDYVVKPWQPEEFIGLIRTWVQKSREAVLV